MAIVAGGAWAGDFIDTRVVFAVANSNVFVKPGETTPSEPGTGIGASRQNTQFYDNFNTRFSGFETLSNISLYKKSPSFFEGFDAEAALNINVLANPRGDFTLFDNASFVKLNYKPAGWGAKEDISFTGFPVSADRFRLGYAWKVTWGGDAAFTYNQGGGLSTSGRPVAVPGAKLQITRDRWYAFVGGKTGLLLNNLLNVQERQYGLLFGGGFDLIPGQLRLEANGGYFTRGVIPSLANLGVRAPVNALGGSMQLSFFSDAILPSLDLRLYKNDPDIAQKFFTPEKYPGGFSYQLSLEGSFLGQTLANPEKFASTRTQYAGALALQARFKLDFWRFYAIGLMRTLSHIQFDVPGVIPYTDFSDGEKVTPELWLALGGDRYLPAQHLTLGLVAGLQNPASRTSPTLDAGGNNPPPGLLGTRTQVFRNVNDPSTLPQGDSPVPIFSIKGTFKLDLSDYFAVLGEVFYNFDNNRVTFRDSVQFISQPVYQQPNQLGFNLVVRAQF
ncbi:MAG: hypothetical protein ACOZQL_13380 [Myxococcota bacterium]